MPSAEKEIYLAWMKFRPGCIQLSASGSVSLGSQGARIKNLLESRISLKALP
jgi:hypothetical protein